MTLTFAERKRLSVFTQPFRLYEHKNYHSAGVQIKFNFFAEQKQLANPLSES